MKILQVIPVLYSSSGGPAAVVRSISKELAKRHELTVYTTNALDQRHGFNTHPFKVESNGYKIVYFPRILASCGFNISPSMAIALQKTLPQYDVVHLHSWRHFQDIIVHHYAKKYNIPYVQQSHGSLPRIVAKQKLKWVYDVFFGYRLLRDASKVIALSQLEAEQYRRVGVPEKKIAIIPNGIDLSEYADQPPKGSFKNKYGIDQEERMVLYLGRIHKSKGLDLLAQAFGIISKNHQNVKLVLVGPDDGYKTTFLKLILEMGLEDRILFTGFVSQTTKLAALVDSDVFVTPRFLGFPVTFLDALFTKCPIVTTSNELDWIDDNVGYVSEATSFDFARAVCDILDNQQTREKFRKNCDIYIKHFEISKIVYKLEKIYLSVANSTK